MTDKVSKDECWKKTETTEEESKDEIRNVEDEVLKDEETADEESKDVETYIVYQGNMCVHAHHMFYTGKTTYEHCVWGKHVHEVFGRSNDTSYIKGKQCTNIVYGGLSQTSHGMFYTGK